MLNQCQFIGRLGKDPEIRTTQSGAKFANFSLAVSEKYKDKNGDRQERTDWVNVVCWSEGLIKVIEAYVSKGDLIFISGKLQTRSWEKDGEKRYTTEIVMQGFDAKLTLLGGGKGEKDTSHFEEAKQAASEGFEDEIPF